MVQFPTTIEAAKITGSVIRAGGTDLSERRRMGLAPGPLVDLRDVPGLDAIAIDEHGASIGAMVRLCTIADDATIRARYPGFAAAAAALATPQIRAVATLGGSLLQRSRCWYFRNPDATCLKKGGSSCLARAGDHLHHACFDLGPCVAVHPSTLGMALLAYDAEVAVHGGPDRSIAALFGDGSDPRREHTLQDGAVLTAVKLPAAIGNERAAYFRTIARAYSEWPIVEAIVRLSIRGGKIEQAAVAIGGVAPIPLRLPKVEAALSGHDASPKTYAAAAALASEGAKPLPMTAYKVDLVRATVLEALERAHEVSPHGSAEPQPSPEPSPEPEPTP